MNDGCAGVRPRKILFARLRLKIQAQPASSAAISRYPLELITRGGSMVAIRQWGRGLMPARLHFGSYYFFEEPFDLSFAQRAF